MFMRLVQMQVKRDSIDKLSKKYREEVIPRLGKTDGCRFASLVQSAGNLDECMSLTLWQSASAAEAYVKSGTYAALLDSLTPYLAETSEWKVKLTEDQRIEYVPVAEEPSVKAYNVTLAPGDLGIVSGNPDALYVRVLSVRLKPDGMDEFRKIYEHEILPALHRCANHLDKFKHGKVDTMLWVSFGIITVFGGATLVLHDESFIKWKPTVLYWLFSATLLISNVAFKKNLIRTFLQEKIALPVHVWGSIKFGVEYFFFGAWLYQPLRCIQLLHR